MNQKFSVIIRGMKDGFPICLGYFSVSFAFGMEAVGAGLPVWTALLISMTNLTSAGQFAGLTLIASGGGFLELAVTTLIINIRYTLMSFSLSQKFSSAVSRPIRALLAFCNTDEIFAVAMGQEGKVTAPYFIGLSITPYLGWALGTFFGAAASGLLPSSMQSALGIAIYGMFLAIFIPPARQSRPILLVVLFAGILGFFLSLIPFLSSGWRIILCAVAASLFGALRFPIREEETA